MEAVLNPICPVCRKPQPVRKFHFLSHAPAEGLVSKSPVCAGSYKAIAGVTGGPLPRRTPQTAA